MNREYTRTLLEAMTHLLRAAAFKRRGQLFERVIGDVVQLVQLQKSISNTSHSVRVTINLAIWVPVLAPVRGGVRERLSEPGAHWRQRLGFTMPEHRDVWWEITCASDAARAATEIAAALRQHGLPSLDAVQSAADLATLWRSGVGHGLTAHQRNRYLAQLTALESAGAA
jgi:Domain of unknown function (DUF4304)